MHLKKFQQRLGNCSGGGHVALPGGPKPSLWGTGLAGYDQSRRNLNPYLPRITAAHTWGECRRKASLTQPTTASRLTRLNQGARVKCTRPAARASPQELSCCAGDPSASRGASTCGLWPQNASWVPGRTRTALNL